MPQRDKIRPGLSVSKPPLFIIIDNFAKIVNFLATCGRLYKIENVSGELWLCAQLVVDVEGDCLSRGCPGWFATVSKDCSSSI